MEKALKMLIALPCTRCTVEQSFRIIKTQLRSTMAKSRLGGLTMNNHRRLILANLEDFNKKVAREFEKSKKIVF